MHTLETTLYRGANAALVCYDIGNKESFENVESKWLKATSEHSIEAIALVGTKSDSSRAVDAANAQALADKHGFDFFETSAKDASNIAECFNKFLLKVVCASPDHEAAKEEAAKKEEALRAAGVSSNPKEFKVQVQFVHNVEGKGLWMRMPDEEVNGADTFGQLWAQYSFKMLNGTTPDFTERATFQKPTWIAVSYPGKAPVVVKDFGGTLAANGISKETFEMTDGDSFNPAEPKYIVFFIDCGSDSYDFTCYAGDRGECSLNA